MKDFFEAKDFMDISPNQYTDVARMANKKLNALIESWPVVFCKAGQTEALHQWFNTSHKDDTHKARLAFIEETVKEPCKHEPIDHWTVSGELRSLVTCKHCGVELQATWSEKK